MTSRVTYIKHQQQLFGFYNSHLNNLIIIRRKPVNIKYFACDVRDYKLLLQTQKQIASGLCLLEFLIFVISSRALQLEHISFAQLLDRNRTIFKRDVQSFSSFDRLHFIVKQLPPLLRGSQANKLLVWGFTCQKYTVMACK